MNRKVTKIVDLNLTTSIISWNLNGVNTQLKDKEYWTRFFKKCMLSIRKSL